MALARAFYDNIYTLEQIHQLTKIDRWFLFRMQGIIETCKLLEKYSINSLPTNLLREAKQIGFSDIQIARSIQR